MLYQPKFHYRHNSSSGYTVGIRYLANIVQILRSHKIIASSSNSELFSSHTKFTNITEASGINLYLIVTVRIDLCL